MSTLSITSGLAGVAALASRRARPVAGAVAGAVVAAIADDVSNGPRLFRRAASPAADDLERRRRLGDAERAAHARAARPSRRRPHRQDLRRHPPAPGGARRSPGSSSASTPRCRCGGRLMGAPALVALGSLRGRRGLIAGGRWPARRWARRCSRTSPAARSSRRQRQPHRGGGAGGAGRAAARRAASRACASCWRPAEPRRSSRAASTALPAATSRRWIASAPGSSTWRRSARPG